VLPASSAGD